MLLPVHALDQRIQERVGAVQPAPRDVDPRGVVETAPLALSERPATLEGLRLGVLDNTNWNANRLLRKTVAKLQQETPFAAVNDYRKESFAKEADPALSAISAANNDIVIALTMLVNTRASWRLAGMRVER